MTLAEVQERFSALLVAHAGEQSVPAAEVEGLFVDGPRLGASRRAGLYAGMYLFRQVDALREDFPRLVRLLGDEGFFELCSAYVRAHPSESHTLAQLGRLLPSFLADREGPRPDLADLAALEWARSDAFLAPDAAPLPLSALAEIGGGLAGAVLRLSPSVRVLTLGHDAPALWSALEECGCDAPAPAPAPCNLLVWRKGFEVFHARVGAEELEALRRAARGEPGAAVCEAFLPLGDRAGEAAVAALASWFNEGLVVSLAVG